MKLMTTTHPSLSLLEDLLREPFEMFSPFFEAAAQNLTQPGLHSAEWFEDNENYYAKIDIPGVTKEQIELEFDEATVKFTISKDDAESRKELRVPEGIEIDKAEATLNNGVLTLQLPKSPEKQPVSIVVE